MHERDAQQAARNDAATRAYIRQAAGSGGTAEELDKLAQLRQNGVITDEEFEQQKAKLLA